MADHLINLTKGDDPLDLAEVKAYLKVDSADDDGLITALIDVAVEYAQSYTGRQYRASSQWRLLVDAFADRLCVRRSPVESITKIEYLVSSVWTTVASSVYYLKNGPLYPEILLSDGEVWPIDLDEIEHGIRIDFATGAHAPSLNSVKVGMLRHIAAMYDDRGDSEMLSSVQVGGALPLMVLNDTARRSGAPTFYASHRIQRI